VARLLVNDSWYEGVSPTAFYEHDFENLILDRADLLFPGFFSVPFKKTIVWESESKQPDFALVDKEYRDWWIVEVELIHHSLKGHVIPQVEVFKNGTYTESHARYMATKNLSLELPRLLDLMKGDQPDVLVVVNSPAPKWVQPLKQAGAIMSVAELFRSDTNSLAVRLNGESPTIPAKLVTRCRFSNLLPRMLVIDSPGAFAADHDQIISISYEGNLTQWKRFYIQDQVWLNPLQNNPLAAGSDYEIYRGDDGNLTITQAH